MKIPIVSQVEIVGNINSLSNSLRKIYNSKFRLKEIASYLLSVNRATVWECVLHNCNNEEQLWLEQNKITATTVFEFIDHDGLVYIDDWTLYNGLVLEEAGMNPITFSIVKHKFDNNNQGNLIVGKTYDISDLLEE
jgi:hypothetical protein